MKEQLFAYLDTRRQEMNEMADAIFTHPETGHNEYFASSLLCDFLTKEGSGGAGARTAGNSISGGTDAWKWQWAVDWTSVRV